MKRQPIVGMSLKNYINTNAKMRELCQAIRELSGNETTVEQFLFPSLGTLPAAQSIFQNQSQIGYGAQNIAPAQNGAYTGEYSIETLLELGGSYVELGHNERLHLFHETPEMVQQKIQLTLANHCTPVICIGEGNQQLPWEEFSAVLTEQLQTYLQGLEKEQLAKVILAYEPGWAIGKTEAAPAEFVHQAHQKIRELLEKLFGAEIASTLRIIYGGSVSKENTAAIAASADVDGVFIGRFGHDPKNYHAILELVKAAKEV